MLHTILSLGSGELEIAPREINTLQHTESPACTPPIFYFKGAVPNESCIHCDVEAGEGGNMDGETVSSKEWVGMASTMEVGTWKW